MNSPRPTVCNHDAHESPALSVIAPCLNEEGNIDCLVSRTLASFDGLRIPAELILVDDGSTDRTWTAICESAARDPRVRGVRHDANRGIEAAWRSGMDASPAGLLCLIDADLQNQPEDIARLYQTYIRELPDLVQGVRHAAPGARSRQLFSRVLNFLLNAGFGMHLRDNKSGFILCRREVLASILRHRRRYRYFQSFLGVAAGHRGYTVAEIDTAFAPRHSGRSFLGRFPVLVSLRILWELCKFRFETWRESGASRSSLAPTWRSAPLSNAAGTKV